MIFCLAAKHLLSRGDWKARAFSSLPDNLRHILIIFLIPEIFIALAND